MKKIAVCLAAIVLLSLPTAFAAEDAAPLGGDEITISPMFFNGPYKPPIVRLK